MKKKWVQVKGGDRKNLVVFLVGIIFLGVAGVVQAAQPPQPPPRFQEVEGSNGSIVRDNNTGLEWQRCVYGQSWTGSGCSGTPWGGKWDNAVRITASGGFRLPTIDELKTLAPLDKSIFPGDYYLWSSLPGADNRGYAWSLDSDDGYSDNCFWCNYYEVRLVRRQ